MPPKPVIQSERGQQIAVAVLMCVFFVCATGLAYLQAGEGESDIHAPKRQVQRLLEPQTEPGIGKQVMLIDTPADWRNQTDEPGQIVATDPDRPTRSITLLTVRLEKRTSPEEVLTRYIQAHLPPTTLQTLDMTVQPSTFKLPEQGLIGAQFIGTSQEIADDGTAVVRQHLIACISRDGYAYGTIYLSDLVDLGTDELDALRSNHRLLGTICESVRVEDE